MSIIFSGFYDIVLYVADMDSSLLLDILHV
jgi:hypothetical protein